MKSERITEITVETDDLFVIRRPERVVQAWCAECSAEVQMARPGEAAIIAGVSCREVVRQVEAAAFTSLK